MKRKMRIRIVRFSNLINRNTGFLIVLTMVIFGFAIIDFQRDNQRILQDTHSTVDNTERLLIGQRKNTEQQAKAVQDLLADNKRQTELIICLLAIHGESTAVTQADEESCRQRIATAQEVDRAERTSTPEVSPRTKPDKLPQGEPPEDNPPPEDNNPGLLKRLTNVADRVLQLLRGKE